MPFHSPFFILFFNSYSYRFFIALYFMVSFYVSWLFSFLFIHLTIVLLRAVIAHFWCSIKLYLSIYLSISRSKLHRDFNVVWSHDLKIFYYLALDWIVGKKIVPFNEKIEKIHNLYINTPAVVCLSGLLLGIRGSHAAETRRVGVARSNSGLFEVG